MQSKEEITRLIEQDEKEALFALLKAQYYDLNEYYSLKNKRGRLNASLAYHLSFYSEFYEYLQEHPEIIETLNLNVEADYLEEKGSLSSLLQRMAWNDKGLGFLKKEPQLLQKGDVNVCITQGYYKGITVLWTLAEKPDGRAILKENPELLQNGNLDACPVEGKDKGITVLWFLAWNPDGRAILKENPELLRNGNLDACPVEGNLKGTTILWLLAGTLEGRAILKENPELLQNGNLDACPVKGKDKGKTVLWFLACNPDGIAILKENPEFLRNGNLEACPVEGDLKGTTILCLLAGMPEGRAILKENLELLRKGNLEACPVEGVHKGKTVLWFLARNPDGRAILKENPELLRKGNLEACPVEGNFKGTTILCLLAVMPEGRAILKENPELLRKGNLEACPVEGNFKGTTILCLLAGAPEGRAILKENPELLQNGNLDACAVEGAEKGKTVLWLLARNSEGRAILKENPQLLRNGNLDACPAEEELKGNTVLWLLASGPDGRTILKEQPDLLRKGNLAACPVEGDFKGIMALNCLIEDPSTRALILRDPTLLCIDFSLHHNKVSILRHLKNYPNTTYLAQAYEDALFLFEQRAWTQFSAKLTQHPWLCKMKFNKESTTLLHLLVEELNQYNETRLSHFLTKHEGLMEVLRAASSLTNEDGEVAEMCANAIALRNAVRVKPSVIQLLLEECFLDQPKIMSLVRDILVGRCALPKDTSIYFLDPEQPGKQGVLNSMEELREFLGDRINLLGHFIDKELSYSAALKLQSFYGTMNQIGEQRRLQGEETRFFQPNCLLNSKKLFLLEGFLQNLIDITHSDLPSNPLMTNDRKREGATLDEERDSKRLKV